MNSHQQTLAKIHSTPSHINKTFVITKDDWEILSKETSTIKQINDETGEITDRIIMSWQEGTLNIDRKKSTFKGIKKVFYSRMFDDNIVLEKNTNLHYKYDMLHDYDENGHQRFTKNPYGVCLVIVSDPADPIKNKYKNDSSRMPFSINYN